MKHRTKKYTRYSFRKEFTTVLEKSPETTSNALLGTQWGQIIIETNVLGISSSDLVMTKFEYSTCHDKFLVCLWVLKMQLLKYFGSSMGHKPVKATRYTNPSEVLLLPPPLKSKCCLL